MQRESSQDVALRILTRHPDCLADNVPLNDLVDDIARELDAAAAAARLTVGGRKKGRPFAAERHKTLCATRPWESMGISVRTWYRREAMKRASNGNANGT